MTKLLDLVSDTVTLGNHHQAVSFSTSHHLTYADLANISSKVTKLLQTASVNGEVVCVHLDDNTYEILLYIPVILAILRTDSAFYFIRDSNKIREEMDRLGAQSIITSSQQYTSSYRVETSLGILHLSILPGSSSVLPSDTCYLISTSGTTGASKLVYVTNNSVVPNVQDLKQHFSPSSDDLFFLTSPLTFDPHILDIFVSLSSTARLLMLPRTCLTKGNIEKQLFTIYKVTIMQCTPSMLERMGKWEDEAGTFRILAVGGEKCSEMGKKILSKMWSQNVTIYHLYGLTEMSVWQVMSKLDTLDLVVNPPVYIEGKNLLSNTQISLGEDNEILVSSNVRKCWVGGEEISEMKTGDIANWQGSRLYWDGRKDDMVKVMGKKVSLQKVGDVLSCKLSTAVVCILGKNDIVHAFVKDVGDTRLTNISLMKLAKENLAANEIPGIFRIVKTIPMTPHGKIDKRKLISWSEEPISETSHTTKRKEPNNSDYDYVASSSLLSSLWSAAVGALPSEDDNFVSSGGDSFSAVTLVNTLSSKIAVKSTMLETLLRGTYSQLLTLLKNSYPSQKATENSGVKKTRLLNGTSPRTESKKVISKVKGRPGPSYVESDEKAYSVTMSTVWSVDMEKCIDSSPLYISGNDVVISCSHSGKICSVKLMSGCLVWSTHLPDRVEGGPATNHNGEILLVGCYDNNLYCLAVDTGTKLWIFSTGGLVKCSPLVTMGMVVFGSYDHRFYMVKTEDGGEVWSKEVAGSVLASPVMLESTILVATLSGEVSSVDPVDGRTVWSIELGHPVFGTPLYTGNGCALVPCVNNTLYNISHTGTIMWTVSTGGPIFSSPIQIKDRILFGCHDGKVYCVTEGGHVVWTRVVGSEVAGALDCNHKGEISCCSVDGAVYLLSWDGGLISSMELGGEIFSSPLMLDNRVVVGSRDNTLYCVQFQYNTSQE